jgi:hypothetical protein
MRALDHFNNLADAVGKVMPNWSDDDVERFLTRDSFGVKMTKHYLKQQREKEAAPSSSGAKHLHELAGLVMRAKGVPYERALDYLMHHRDGRALATSLKRHRDAGSIAHQKEITMKYPMMPDRQTVLKGMLRANNGLDGLARNICKNGSSDISEHEFTSLITQAAKAAYPTLTEAAAFSKMFQGSELLRRAHQVVQYVKGDDSSDLDDAFDDNPRRGYRQRSRTPDDADEDAQKDRTERLDGLDDEDGEGDAYCEIEARAKQLQKRDPSLSFEQAFSRAYQDPANKALVAAERARNGVR